MNERHVAAVLLFGAVACARAATPQAPSAVEPAPAAPPAEMAPAAATSAPAVGAPAAKPLATTPSTVNLPADYTRSLASSAYIWAYPMVNVLNRRAAITTAPEPGRLNGVI